MNSSLNAMRDWNESIEDLQTDFNVTMFHADGIKEAMIKELNKAIKSKGLSFLFGKHVKIKPFGVAGINLLYKCRIKGENDGLFFLRIKPYERSNIPGSLSLEGENLKTGRQALRDIDDISPKGIKKLAKEMATLLTI